MTLYFLPSSYRLLNVLPAQYLSTLVSYHILNTSINLAAYYIREPAAVGKILAGREPTATGSR